MRNRMFGAKGFIIIWQLLMNAVVVDCYVRWRVDEGAVRLTTYDIKDVREKYELVLVNFYHRDCPHSQMFVSIYDEAADIIRHEFPEYGTVLMGKADCSQERSFIDEQDIVKFPTVRLFRRHMHIISEYRGPRTIDGLLDYVRNQLKDPIVKVKALGDLNHINWRRRNMIGYFESDSSDEYKAFEQVSRAVRDYCDLYAAVGTMAASQRKRGDKIVFRAIGNTSDVVYPGSPKDFDHMLHWAMGNKCFTVITEMTFDKAEEAAEFLQPLLILFHHPDDTKTRAVFDEQVNLQLQDEITRIRFVTADGLVFSAPLQRLGKTQKDLPLLVIDTYQHMYLWPFDPKTKLEEPDLLTQFVDDLHSGKLHEIYHEQHPEEPRETISFDSEGNPTPQPHRPRGSRIESEFVKLGPASSRFTFVQKEEL